MQLLFLLFSSYFASLFCLYLNTGYADLKVPFDMMGSHIGGDIPHPLGMYNYDCEIATNGQGPGPP